MRAIVATVILVKAFFLFLTFQQKSSFPGLIQLTQISNITIPVALPKCC